jgi:predicted transposase/invertase (TIGR01784 family)
MSDDDVHQSHDKLFKVGFSDTGNAAALLRAELPQAVSSLIDWEHLRLESGTFIDSHYRHTQSDLLYSAPFEGSECLIYILFEHQTTRDPLLSLRLLRYMVRIWESFTTAHPKTVKLPVVLPVVLTQNAEVWSIDSRFSSMLDLPDGFSPELRDYFPDFRFRLLQLAEMPFESIRGTPAGILILRTMKAERLARLLDAAVWDESLLAQIPRETFELLLRYILAADIDKDSFESKIKSIGDAKTRLSAMTLAQQYRQEGLEKGLEKGLVKGLEKGRQEDVIEALQIRFGQLPESAKEAVVAVTGEVELRRLLRAAIQVESLETFLREV